MEMSELTGPSLGTLMIDDSYVTEVVNMDPATRTDDSNFKTEHDSQDWFAEDKQDSLRDTKEEPEYVCFMTLF